MTHYDYKVVPAPIRSKRVKGVQSAEEQFALTLAEEINAVARQGWEYVRAETLHHETPRGWFRRAASSDQSVLIFRRERELAGPRLAAVKGEPAGADARERLTAPRAEPTFDGREHEPAEQAVLDRLQTSLGRREPLARFEPRAEPEDAMPTPLRAPPRLGPAEKP
jgi:hypothetical protein